MELLKVDTEVSITLKDLTDLIGVRHNDAMKKVYDLSMEDGFGLLRETRISHVKGKEITTYLLNSKQAIAAGARLNNALLMKVIDKMEELEKERQQPTQKLPTNPMEILQLVFDAQKATNIELIEIKDEIEELKGDIVLTPSQKRILQKSVSTKVYSFNAPTESNKKLFSKIYSKLKDRFAVSSYMEIPRLQFNEAKSMVDNITLIDLV